MILSDDPFSSAESADFQFIEASITNNCLEVRYSSSGCDGSTWNMRLINLGSTKGEPITCREETPG